MNQPMAKKRETFEDLYKRIKDIEIFFEGTDICGGYESEVTVGGTAVLARDLYERNTNLENEFMFNAIRILALTLDSSIRKISKLEQENEQKN